MKLAHLHFKSHEAEPVWHVQLALLVAIGLQFVLTNNLTVGPRYMVAGLELFLLLVLVALRPDRKGSLLNIRHFIATILLIFISIANITSLFLVIHSLFGHNLVTGRELIYNGVIIYLTNIIVFGLWYWELDGDNIDNSEAITEPIDFLFPQMTSGGQVENGKVWVPTFFDYLYVSVTNGTAFSPTDTLPLTHRAKLLMSIQALVSLLTVALVAARAINILG